MTKFITYYKGDMLFESKQGGHSLRALARWDIVVLPVADNLVLANSRRTAKSTIDDAADYRG